jgi:hypothetical protein
MVRQQRNREGKPQKMKRKHTNSDPRSGTSAESQSEAYARKEDSGKLRTDSAPENALKSEPPSQTHDNRLGREHDRQRLDELEARIQQGLETFIDVGQALLEVRDRKLYELRSYATFDTYCRNYLGISRQRGYQLMDAAEVAKNLSTIVDTALPANSSAAGDKIFTVVDTPLPTNEAQARELTGLEFEQQRKIWGEAVRTAPTKQPTAKHIKQTRAKLVSVSEEPKPVEGWKLVKLTEKSLVKLLEKLFTRTHVTQHEKIYRIISDLCARQLDEVKKEATDE